jgi:hypothetical protein
VDGMHVVGDILTKISTNCVINLHVALLFTCLFYGFIICVGITVWKFWVFPVYVACLCLLLLPCEFMPICNVFVCYILHVCLKCMQLDKIYVA